jgi:hypothetical protein
VFAIRAFHRQANALKAKPPAETFSRCVRSRVVHAFSMGQLAQQAATANLCAALVQQRNVHARCVQAKARLRFVKRPEAARQDGCWQA